MRVYGRPVDRRDSRFEWDRLTREHKGLRALALLLQPPLRQHFRRPSQASRHIRPDKKATHKVDLCHALRRLLLHHRQQSLLQRSESPVPFLHVRSEPKISRVKSARAQSFQLAKVGACGHSCGSTMRLRNFRSAVRRCSDGKILGRIILLQNTAASAFWRRFSPKSSRSGRKACQKVVRSASSNCSSTLIASQENEKAPILQGQLSVLLVIHPRLHQ